ncbi:serine-rich adhesin for platelets-like, partial [Musca vetustissima]|uniref:serine-rich adhesin for platelets-like n=1 Tax=Musca vetustissima TaxID=27455 RepID=UPI002AB6FC41
MALGIINRLKVKGEDTCQPTDLLINGQCLPVVADLYVDEDDDVQMKFAKFDEDADRDVDITTENIFIGYNFGNIGGEESSQFYSTTMEFLNTDGKNDFPDATSTVRPLDPESLDPRSAKETSNSKPTINPKIENDYETRITTPSEEENRNDTTTDISEIIDNVEIISENETDEMWNLSHESQKTRDKFSVRDTTTTTSSPSDHEEGTISNIDERQGSRQNGASENALDNIAILAADSQGTTSTSRPLNPKQDANESSSEVSARESSSSATTTLSPEIAKEYGSKTSQEEQDKLSENTIYLGKENLNETSTETTDSSDIEIRPEDQTSEFLKQPKESQENSTIFNVPDTPSTSNPLGSEQETADAREKEAVEDFLDGQPISSKENNTEEKLEIPSDVKDFNSETSDTSDSSDIDEDVEIISKDPYRFVGSQMKMSQESQESPKTSSTASTLDTEQETTFHFNEIPDAAEKEAAENPLDDNGHFVVENEQESFDEQNMGGEIESQDTTSRTIPLALEKDANKTLESSAAETTSSETTINTEIENDFGSRTTTGELDTFSGITTSSEQENLSETAGEGQETYKMLKVQDTQSTSSTIDLEEETTLAFNEIPDAREKGAAENHINSSETLESSAVEISRPETTISLEIAKDLNETATEISDSSDTEIRSKDQTNETSKQTKESQEISDIFNVPDTPSASSPLDLGEETPYARETEAAKNSLDNNETFGVVEQQISSEENYKDEKLDIPSDVKDVNGEISGTSKSSDISEDVEIISKNPSGSVGGQIKMAKESEETQENSDKFNIPDAPPTSSPWDNEQGKTTILHETQDAEDKKAVEDFLDNSKSVATENQQISSEETNAEEKIELQYLLSTNRPFDPDKDANNTLQSSAGETSSSETTISLEISNEYESRTTTAELDTFSGITTLSEQNNRSEAANETSDSSDKGSYIVLQSEDQSSETSKQSQESLESSDTGYVPDTPSTSSPLVSEQEVPDARVKEAVEGFVESRETFGVVEQQTSSAENIADENIEFSSDVKVSNRETSGTSESSDIAEDVEIISKTPSKYIGSQMKMTKEYQDTSKTSNNIIDNIDATSTSNPLDNEEGSTPDAREKGAMETSLDNIETVAAENQQISSEENNSEEKIEQQDATSTTKPLDPEEDANKIPESSVRETANSEITISPEIAKEYTSRKTAREQDTFSGISNLSEEENLKDATTETSDSSDKGKDVAIVSADQTGKMSKQPHESQETLNKLVVPHTTSTFSPIDNEEGTTFFFDENQDVGKTDDVVNPVDDSEHFDVGKHQITAEENDTDEGIEIPSDVKDFNTETSDTSDSSDILEDVEIISKNPTDFVGSQVKMPKKTQETLKSSDKLNFHDTASISNRLDREEEVTSLSAEEQNTLKKASKEISLDSNRIFEDSNSNNDVDIRYSTSSASPLNAEQETTPDFEKVIVTGKRTESNSLHNHNPIPGSGNPQLISNKTNGEDVLRVHQSTSTSSPLDLLGQDLQASSGEILNALKNKEPLFNGRAFSSDMEEWVTTWAPQIFSKEMTMSADNEKNEPISEAGYSTEGNTLKDYNVPGSEAIIGKSSSQKESENIEADFALRSDFSSESFISDGKDVISSDPHRLNRKMITTVVPNLNKNTTDTPKSMQQASVESRVTSTSGKSQSTDNDHTHRSSQKIHNEIIPVETSDKIRTSETMAKEKAEEDDNGKIPKGPVEIPKGNEIDEDVNSSEIISNEDTLQESGEVLISTTFNNIRENNVETSDKTLKQVDSFVEHDILKTADDSQSDNATVSYLERSGETPRQLESLLDTKYEIPEDDNDLQNPQTTTTPTLSGNSAVTNSPLPQQVEKTLLTKQPVRGDISAVEINISRSEATSDDSESENATVNSLEGSGEIPKQLESLLDTKYEIPEDDNDLQNSQTIKTPTTGGNSGVTNSPIPQPVEDTLEPEQNLSGGISKEVPLVESFSENQVPWVESSTTKEIENIGVGDDFTSNPPTKSHDSVESSAKTLNEAFKENNITKEEYLSRGSASQTDNQQIRLNPMLEEENKVSIDSLTTEIPIFDAASYEIVMKSTNQSHILNKNNDEQVKITEVTTDKIVASSSTEYFKLEPPKSENSESLQNFKNENGVEGLTVLERKDFDGVSAYTDISEDSTDILTVDTEGNIRTTEANREKIVTLISTTSIEYDFMSSTENSGPRPHTKNTESLGHLKDENGFELLATLESKNFERFTEDFSTESTDQTTILNVNNEGNVWTNEEIEDSITPTTIENVPVFVNYPDYGPHTKNSEIIRNWNGENDDDVTEESTGQHSFLNVDNEGHARTTETKTDFNEGSITAEERPPASTENTQLLDKYPDHGSFNEVSEMGEPDISDDSADEISFNNSEGNSIYSQVNSNVEKLSTTPQSFNTSSGELEIAATKLSSSTSEYNIGPYETTAIYDDSESSTILSIVPNIKNSGHIIESLQNTPKEFEEIYSTSTIEYNSGQDETSARKINLKFPTTIKYNSVMDHNLAKESTVRLMDSETTTTSNLIPIHKTSLNELENNFKEPKSPTIIKYNSMESTTTLKYNSVTDINPAKESTMHVDDFENSASPNLIPTHKNSLSELENTSKEPKTPTLTKYNSVESTTTTSTIKHNSVLNQSLSKDSTELVTDSEPATTSSNLMPIQKTAPKELGNTPNETKSDAKQKYNPESDDTTVGYMDTEPPTTVNIIPNGKKSKERKQLLDEEETIFKESGSKEPTTTKYNPVRDTKGSHPTKLSTILLTTQTTTTPIPARKSQHIPKKRRRPIITPPTTTPSTPHPPPPPPPPSMPDNTNNNEITNSSVKINISIMIAGG